MADTGNVVSLRELLGPYARRAESDLARLLVEPTAPGELAEAMRYCVLGSGKRLRPAVVWITAEACAGGPLSAWRGELTARAAVAVELVHCYSLVHDDLPAMDDDELRRGRPTAHVAFGEAMAILVGDALLTRAFGVLGEAAAEGEAGALAGRLAAELAAGAGAAGMIAGQAADMGLSRVAAGSEGLRYIHEHKTAALLRAVARMGGLCGGARPAELDALTGWAEALGWAFQLRDDVLDVTASPQQLGKASGKDADAGKRNAAAEMGLQRAEELAGRLTEQAIEALTPLGGRGTPLRELARLLASRTQ